jgi:cobalt-zinc-cadmium efflux system outer membrane protein
MQARLLWRLLPAPPIAAGSPAGPARPYTGVMQKHERLFIHTAIGVAGAALLSGCVSVPRDAGFSSVQQSVMDRTGHRIEWGRPGDPHKSINDIVDAMVRRELTAEDAVQVALVNNLNLQATYEDLGIAQAEVIEAGLVKNPVVHAEVRFPSYRALPFDVDLSQSFIDLLLMPLRKRMATASFQGVKLRVTHEVLGTIASVKAAFYRAQGSAQLVEMRQSVTAATDASLEAAQRMHDAGNITDLALANERALHEQALIDLAKARRDALNAHEDLGELLGLRPEQIRIAGRLPAIPTEEIGEAGLEVLAVSQRADLGAARSEGAALAATLGLTQSTALISEFDVGGHVSKETDGAISAGPTVSLPLPIFNQGQPAIAAAQARLRQARDRSMAMLMQVRAEVRRARNNMLSARELADHYSRVILPLRHQIVAQNMLQLNAMQIGVFELLLSRQAEIDAGREYVEALEAYWIARAELERAVGGRLPTITATTKATSHF